MIATNGIGKELRAFLNTEEDQAHDFKETCESLKVDDLVAIANAGGGAILLGISARDGTRRIVGCDFSDAAELTIRQKAAEADPPIAVELRAENAAKLAVVLVFIPRGNNRPHCTPGGRYLLRDGNRNRALRPSELLSIFLETQAEVFFKRFKSVSDKLEEQLNDVASHVEDFSERSTRMLMELDRTSVESLELIVSAEEKSAEANDYVQDAASDARQANEQIEQVQEEVRDLRLALDELTIHAGIGSIWEIKAKREIEKWSVAVSVSSPHESDRKLFGELKKLYKKMQRDFGLPLNRVRIIAAEGFITGRGIVERAEAERANESMKGTVPVPARLAQKQRSRKGK